MSASPVVHHVLLVDMLVPGLNSLTVVYGNRRRELLFRRVAVRTVLAGREDPLVAPVRPNWKTRYSLCAFDRYVQGTRRDGAPYYPWLRVHWRIGGRPLQIAAESLVVRGTIPERQDWTDMIFPDSGRYVIPGALEPITIDVH